MKSTTLAQQGQPIGDTQIQLGIQRFPLPVLLLYGQNWASMAPSFLLTGRSERWLRPIRYSTFVRYSE
jgi:hypothetical protein